MYLLVKNLSRRWKRRILLSVDLVLASASLILAFELQENDPSPWADILSARPFFPLLTILAAGGLC